MPIINGKEILFGAQINITQGSGSGSADYVSKTELRRQLRTLKNDVVEDILGAMLSVPFDLELGAFNWQTGALEDATDAVRFAKAIDVNKRTVVSLQSTEYLEYGYVRYDINGHVVKVDNWLPIDSGGDITFEGGGSVLFKFRHTDLRDITEDGISYFFDYVSISTEGGLEYLDNKIEAVAASIGDISSALDELHAYAQRLVSGVNE